MEGREWASGCGGRRQRGETCCAAHRKPRSPCLFLEINGLCFLPGASLFAGAGGMAGQSIFTQKGTFLSPPPFRCREASRAWSATGWEGRAAAAQRQQQGGDRWRLAPCILHNSFCQPSPQTATKPQLLSGSKAMCSAHTQEVLQHQAWQRRSVHHHLKMNRQKEHHHCTLRKTDPDWDHSRGKGPRDAGPPPPANTFATRSKNTGAQDSVRLWYDSLGWPILQGQERNTENATRTLWCLVPQNCYTELRCRKAESSVRCPKSCTLTVQS